MKTGDHKGKLKPWNLKMKNSVITLRCDVFLLSQLENSQAQKGSRACVTGHCRHIHT